MDEFEKGQDKGTQTGEQGDKPAFGQFDNEKNQGQQDQSQDNQSQDKQPQDETADTAQQGDNQFGSEKGEPDQQR